MSKRLSDLSLEWQVPVLFLINAARAMGISHQPSESQINRLKAQVIRECGLSDIQIRALSDYLSSEIAKPLLEEAAAVLKIASPDLADKYLEGFSRRLLSNISDPNLMNLSNTSPYILKQTILNLGVINLPSSGASKPDLETLIGSPIDPDILRGVVKNSYRDVIEKNPAVSGADFLRLREEVKTQTSQLLSYAKMPNQVSLIQCEEANVEKIIRFAESLHLNPQIGLKPRMHQAVRIYEVVHGDYKRIMCADATGAGKTLTAVTIKGLMDRERLDAGKQKTRALVIGPNQGIRSTWAQDEISRYATLLNLPEQSVQYLNALSLKGNLCADFTLINFEKCGILERRNKYLEKLLLELDNFDTVIVDESHNVKNVFANRATSMRRIIERTKDKNFILLSATPIPNSLEDAGFLLYMFDPIKYERYAKEKFVYDNDRYAITNALHSGGWFSLSRDDLCEIFKLPRLREGNSEIGIPAELRYDLSETGIGDYVKVWGRKDGSGKKVVDLSQILLSESKPVIKKTIEAIKSKEPNAKVAIFSYYREGFANELAKYLSPISDCRVINGGISLTERLKRAAEFRDCSGADVCINTLAAMSESISLVTGDRPVYVLFAQPPMVPANFEQAIGRFLRPGQGAPVHCVELIPSSRALEEKMVIEKERNERNGIKFRSTWKPCTIFEDMHQLRLDKLDAIQRPLTGADLNGMAAVLNVTESNINPSDLPSLGVEKNPNTRLNETLKKVRDCKGKGIHKMINGPAREYIVEGYGSDDWELTSSADTNRAIDLCIKAIEEHTGKGLTEILDWGCGSACLARITGRKIHNLDAIPEHFIKGKEKTQQIYGTEIDDYFHEGFAQNMPFPDKRFQLVSSSYALQYNAQGFGHRKDIEEILLETNRVLDIGDYGIFALPNQTTSEQQDIEPLTKVFLPRYGFEVILNDSPSGHALNKKTNREKKVFCGFYLVVYQKKEDARKLHEGDDIIMFSPYKTLGIGGERVVSSLKNGKIYKGEKLPAEIFKGRDGRSLQEIITQALGRK